MREKKLILDTIQEIMSKKKYLINLDIVIRTIEFMDEHNIGKGYLRNQYNIAEHIAREGSLCILKEVCLSRYEFKGKILKIVMRKLNAILVNKIDIYETELIKVKISKGQYKGKYLTLPYSTFIDSIK